MAVDSWVPHRFAALSERLTTRTASSLMGAAALAALVYTSGDVGHLVVMYSINVFLTFSLSMLAMLASGTGTGGPRREWRRRAALFAAGFALCLTILVMTVYEKFARGGWVTIVDHRGRHRPLLRHPAPLRAVARELDQLYRELGDLPQATRPGRPGVGPWTQQPTAAVLVGSYGGVGIHTVLNILRAFPGHFKSLVFVSVGVIDSGEFKGEHAVDDLRRRTEEMLARYVALARAWRAGYVARGHRDGGGRRGREAVPGGRRASSRRSCSSRAR